MKRTSSSYVTTLDTWSANDMQELSLIRKTISKVNKRGNEKYRVCVRGRKPIVKRFTKSYQLVSYDYFGNIAGGLANATKLDVYIYNV